MLVLDRRYLAAAGAPGAVRAAYRAADIRTLAFDGDTLLIRTFSSSISKYLTRSPWPSATRASAHESTTLSAPGVSRSSATAARICAAG